MRRHRVGDRSARQLSFSPDGRRLFVAAQFKERGDWVRVLARKPDKLKTPGPFLVAQSQQCVRIRNQEIVELAFSVLGKPTRIRRVPLWLVKAILPLIRLFSRRYYTIAAGIATMTQNDFVAPSVGTHTLKDFYEELGSEL